MGLFSTGAGDGMREYRQKSVFGRTEVGSHRDAEKKAARKKQRKADRKMRKQGGS